MHKMRLRGIHVLWSVENILIVNKTKYFLQMRNVKSMPHLTIMISSFQHVKVHVTEDAPWFPYVEQKIYEVTN